MKTEQDKERKKRLENFLDAFLDFFRSLSATTNLRTLA